MRTLISEKAPIEDIYEDCLAHHSIKGQKWGIRRFQNPDGSLTPAGRKRYAKLEAYKKEQIGPLARTGVDLERFRQQYESEGDYKSAKRLQDMMDRYALEMHRLYNMTYDEMIAEKKLRKRNDYLDILAVARTGKGRKQTSEDKVSEQRLMIESLMGTTYEDCMRMLQDPEFQKYLKHSDNDWLAHFGILGMKWGIRRFQNKDGSLTPAGRERYGYGSGNEKKRSYKTDEESDKALMYRLTNNGKFSFAKRQGLEDEIEEATNYQNPYFDDFSSKESAPKDLVELTNKRHEIEKKIGELDSGKKIMSELLKEDDPYAKDSNAKIEEYNRKAGELESKVQKQFEGKKTSFGDFLNNEDFREMVRYQDMAWKEYSKLMSSYTKTDSFKKTKTGSEFYRLREEYDANVDEFAGKILESLGYRNTKKMRDYLSAIEIVPHKFSVPAIFNID